MGLIEIEGMEFYAFHGHFDSEQTVGNRFLVDIAIVTDCRNAINSDNLGDTLNYQSVYETIKTEMQKPSRLLEHVAGRILDRIRNEFDVIGNVKVKISKMNPPMGGQIERVSVTLER